MFRLRLTRIPYAFWTVVYEVWALRMLDIDADLSIALLLASLPVFFVFVILPRVRDCDWPLWIGFTTFIPLIGGITGTGLLLARPKYFHRRSQQSKNEAEQNSQDLISPAQ